MRLPARAFRWTSSLAGALLLVWLVGRDHPLAILDAVGALSWRLGVLLVFPSSVDALFDTLAWRFAFRAARPPFATLLWARLIGEAVNATTPTAQVGGDAVKAWLVRGHVALTEALASVIVAKTTITIAQALLLAVGLSCAWYGLPADSPLLRPMAWLLLAETVAVGGFVAVQCAGAAGAGSRLLDRIGLPVARLGGPALDATLRGFYRGAPGRLALSIAFHFLGWLASAAETWLILRLLGLDVSPLTALVIEAVSTAVRFVTFMVPANLGVLEGGHVAVFVALGLTATAALAFSLVRRLREAAWAGVGYLLLATLGAPAAPPATALAD
jgi:uncharacterized membrane protein YbhN (UPF0104 family)